MGIIANPEKDWRRLGELDPYYGVLRTDALKNAKITDNKKEQFFASGVKHMRICLDVASKRFNFNPGGKALDFGCGVGRLTCAMAPHFSEVIGLDISPGMLTEARIESKKRGWNNILYDLSTEDSRFATNTYDFIHTYIVLQHIPVPNGENIIEKMLASLKVDGVGAIHITYRTSQGRLTSSAREAIKNFLPLRTVGNLLRGKRWNYPTMQMNNYKLSKIFDIFSAQGINEFCIYRVDDWGNFGLFLFFQKRQVSEALSPWSNPISRV
jgi:ubiquinone/menaquinone biosynthesis C-methylase UbiE